MRLLAAKYGTGTFYPFQEHKMFSDYAIANNPDDITPDDCLVVWGGADISPSLYNKETSRFTHADDRPSMRDNYEWALMQRAKELDIPIIGVCRGAQMLCALAGGFLIQDVTNHGRSHKVETYDGKVLNVSSVHHQMMYPWPVAHKILAWSKQKQSTHYKDVNTDVNVPVEPEFVYFPTVRGLAVQWHPEFMDENAEATMYVNAKVKEYLL